MSDLATQASGVVGLSQLNNKFRLLDQAAARLQTKEASRPAIEEMLLRMRRDVPVDSALLKSGIVATFGPGGWMVKASAQRLKSNSSSKLGADYAPFVEYGTKASTKGQRKVSGRLKKRRRKALRTHPGNKAQPFFWQNAKDVFAEYVIMQQRNLTEAAKSFAQ